MNGKSLTAGVTIVIALLGLGLLMQRQAQQMAKIERHLEAVRHQSTALGRILEQLVEGLGDGLPAPPEGRSPAQDDVQLPAEVRGQRRYYGDEEWAALLAPGNLVHPRTQPYREATTRGGGTLSRVMVAQLPGLNRVVVRSASVWEVDRYVNRALAGRARDNPDIWVAELATRVEADDTFTEYRVWLRRGVTWHPPAVDLNDPRYAWLRGEHFVTADDFAFAVEVIQNPAVAAAHLRSSFEDLVGIEVVDDHHLIVRWRRPFVGSIEATLQLEPLPRWLYSFDEDGRPLEPDELGPAFNEHWYNDRMIGCGPYRFVRWERERVLELERWEAYFDEPPPIDRLFFRFIPDANARLNELLAGGVDYTPLLPQQYARAVSGVGETAFRNGRLQTARYQTTRLRFLGWNADRPLFADRRVRLAMTHALDRERILSSVFHGLGRVITGPFFIDGPQYHRGLVPHPFDLGRAETLLADAGWRDRDHDGVRERVADGRPMRFEFTMLTYGERPDFLAAMEIYQSHLASIGVRMTIETVAWPVMVARLGDRDFDAYTGGYAGHWDADPFPIFHSSQADEPSGLNHVGFRNREADALLEAARGTFDAAERVRLMWRLQEVLYEQQPMTFFFSELEASAWRSRVRSVDFSPIYPSDISFAWWLQE